jgi:hypothetical protein
MTAFFYYLQCEQDLSISLYSQRNKSVFRTGRDDHYNQHRVVYAVVSRFA